MLPPEVLEIAVAVVRHAGRVLIGQRPAGVPQAGRWEFPGGKVRPGESPEAAAARECLEETGLAIHVGDHLEEVLHEYDYGRLQIHFFAAAPVEPDRSPLAPFRWIPMVELAGYSFPAANASVLARLLAGE